MKSVLNHSNGKGHSLKMLSTNTIDNVLLIANTSLSKPETCIQALNN